MDNAANTLTYKLRWVFLLIFIISVGLLYWFLDTRILFRWLIVLGVSISIGCMTFSFAGAFTKCKWKKWVAVILIICGGLFWYHIDHRESKVVYMKENVLYIRPSSHIEQE